MQGVADSITPAEHLIDGGWLPGDTCAQIGALNIVHHQVLAILENEMVGNPRQVGMTQGRQQASLPSKLPFGFGVEVEVLFYCDFNVKRDIVRKVYRAHAALTELSLDAVALVEDVARLQRHG